MVPRASARDPWTGVEIVSLYGERRELAPAAPRGVRGARPAARRPAGHRHALLHLRRDGGLGRRGGARRRLRGLDPRSPESARRRGHRGQPPGARLRLVRRRLPDAGAARPHSGRDRPPRGAPPASGAALPRVIAVEGWRRGDLWPATGRPWIAPSPNMPTYDTALVYPGLCLLEATELSEGRGTTRPFLLFGAPGLRPTALAEALLPLRALGVAAVPTYFRPQFQKHRGEVCGGVELVIVRRGEGSGLSPRSRDPARPEERRPARSSAGARRPTSSSPTVRRSTCSPAATASAAPSTASRAPTSQAWLATFAADETGVPRGKKRDPFVSRRKKLQ